MSTKSKSLTAVGVGRTGFGIIELAGLVAIIEEFNWGRIERVSAVAEKGLMRSPVLSMSFGDGDRLEYVKIMKKTL